MQFDQVLGMTPRIILASFIAFIVSQHVDIYLFHYFKHKTNNKALWLRNNFSTIPAQTIDTLLFVLIAFAGKFSFQDLSKMILGFISIKFAIAIIDTPFIYLVRNICQKKTISNKSL